LCSPLGWQSSNDPNIDVDSEDILLEHFKMERDMASIQKKNSGETFQENYDEHIKVSKKYLMFTKQLEKHDKESIKRTTEHIISRFTEYIKNIQGQQHDYNPSYFHEILRIIEEKVKSAPNEGRYTFTSKYKIDLSLCLFQRASENFKEMHRAFKSSNDPVNYLESKKDDIFMSFKISCQGAISIKSLVDFQWKKLTPAVFTTMWEKNGPSNCWSHAIYLPCIQWKQN
uniref:Uncharacterized protein n=1 Tax=Rhinolophus ferrumequinum TaxID=59479 RepID=A0A671E7C8_RHIFE